MTLCIVSYAIHYIMSACVCMYSNTINPGDHYCDLWPVCDMSSVPLESLVAFLLK